MKESISETCSFDCNSYNEQHMTITRMEICGDFYDRETMAVKHASNCLHDAKPIADKTCGGLGMRCTIL